MQENNKIKELEELAKILAGQRSKGKKIVQCHGVFDLLHIGHIRHFEQAKTHGDILVVTVTQDKYVNKGPHRPAFPENLRAESVAALDCVDYVAINNWPTSVEAIKLLKPNFYAKGSEYRDARKDMTGKITDEEAAVKSVKGKVVFTEDITFSSSSLLNKYLPAFPKEITDYLTGFTGRYSEADILKYMEKARKLKVLVVGEAIIDEYQYCESIGKSTKEPALVAQFQTAEKYAGGILAVANHLANFSDNVGMLTFLGDNDSQEDFVRSNVNEKVAKEFFYKKDSPTIVKRRFVESYLLTKLFEIYVINAEELGAKENKEFCRKLKALLPQYDIVIVVDYGHGMMTEEARDILCKQAKFLAVNTQSNAGNRGFNTIYKYRRADFVTIAEHEIRLEFRNLKGNLKEMVEALSEKMGNCTVIVTRGKYGSLCYSPKEGFFEVPAFAQQVVDRIGAGDALLSLTSLCVAQKAPIEVVGFIGNVVGAEAVMTVGNKTPIDRVSLLKHIVSLLK
jgi:rfaE bifunctional protein kinase chain/domain/rfaE bifunctional protein nucleotidyltransferase chain/domain